MHSYFEQFIAGILSVTFLWKTAKTQSQNTQELDAFRNSHYAAQSVAATLPKPRIRALTHARHLLPELPFRPTRLAHFRYSHIIRCVIFPGLTTVSLHRLHFGPHTNDPADRTRLVVPGHGLGEPDHFRGISLVRPHNPIHGWIE